MHTCACTHTHEQRERERENNNTHTHTHKTHSHIHTHTQHIMPIEIHKLRFVISITPVDEFQPCARNPTISAHQRRDFQTHSTPSQTACSSFFFFILKRRAMGNGGENICDISQGPPFKLKTWLRIRTRKCILEFYESVSEQGSVYWSFYSEYEFESELGRVCYCVCTCVPV